MFELKLEAVNTNAEAVRRYIDDKLSQFSCSREVKTQIAIAVDELFNNIASYAYYPATGSVTIQFEVTGSPLSAVITFIDKGQPFNPLIVEDPDTSLSADERMLGGLGILIIKKSMDEFQYEYKDHQNVVTIKKILN